MAEASGCEGRETVTIKPGAAANGRIVFNVLTGGVGVIAILSLDRFLVAFGFLLVTFAALSAIGMRRASVTSDGDDVRVANVWIVRSHPCDAVTALEVGPRLHLWTFAPDAGVPMRRDVLGTRLLLDGRSIDCEALRCRASDPAIDLFVANLECLATNMGVPVKVARTVRPNALLPDHWERT